VSVHRPLRWPLLVAVLVVAAFLHVPAGAAPTDGSATCPVEVEGRVGTWVRRAAPTTPSGLDRITAHAVDPRDGRRHLVTDGLSILRTVDDGCTWDPTFSLPAEVTATFPASAATDRILDLIVHPTTPDRVWAVVGIGEEVADRLDSPGLILAPASRARRDLTATLVLRSDDGGQHWRPMRTPSVLPGAPIRLAPAPSAPDVAYLSINGVVHVTEDGGDTWLARPAPVTSPTAPRPPWGATPVAFDLAVHPLHADVVFSQDRDHAYRSDDGGLTWTVLPPAITNAPTGPFLDPHGLDDDGVRLVYLHQVLQDQPPRAVYRYREDEGALQEQRITEDAPMRGAPLDLVWHPERDEALVATWRNHVTATDRLAEVSLYLLDLERPRDGGQGAHLVDVDELGLSPLRGVDVDLAGTYHLHTLEELVSLRTEGDPESGVGARRGTSRCEAIEDVPTLHPATPAPHTPASLDAPRELVADAGGEVTGAVTLELPAQPGALDLYLLLDTSNGFRDDLGDVARGMAGVVTALADAGVDVHVGLGGLGTADTYRYRRVVDIAPPGEELHRGLTGLCAAGSYESHLLALHQTATGSGVPDGGRLRPEVPAGQDPTWRDGSLRTVVVVTDNEFDDRTLKEDDPDAPPRQVVFDAFAARGLHAVGIEIVRDVVTPVPQEGQEGTPGWLAVVEAADAAGETAPTPAREDLEALASATGTVAPPGGVDCRDTGRNELTEGDPLVCTTFSTAASRLGAGQSTMGDVLRRVLLAQEDRRPVTIEVGDAGDLAVTVSPVAGTPAEVDVRRDHVAVDALRYEATVACPAAGGAAGRTVELAATVDGATVAVGEVAVSCASQPTPAATGAGPPPASTELSGPGEPGAEAGTGVGALPPTGAPAGGVPVAGHAPALGQASAPGQVLGHAHTPGHATAPGAVVEGGVAGSATGAASPGAGGASSSSAAAASGPADRRQAQLALAQAGRPGAELGHAPLTFSARAAPAAPFPTSVWLSVAAGSFAAALRLGASRPPSHRPARAERRSR
jgi:hypothetical protein